MLNHQKDLWYARSFYIIGALTFGTICIFFVLFAMMKKNDYLRKHAKKALIRHLLVLVCLFAAILGLFALRVLEHFMGARILFIPYGGIMLFWSVYVVNIVVNSVVAFRKVSGPAKNAAEPVSEN
jgi:hypothetical protein